MVVQLRIVSYVSASSTRLARSGCSRYTAPQSVMPAEERRDVATLCCCAGHHSGGAAGGSGFAVVFCKKPSRLPGRWPIATAFVLVLAAASWIGAGSLFAGAENAYRNGFAALWQAGGGWLGLLLIYFIGRRGQEVCAVLRCRICWRRAITDGASAGHLQFCFAY